MDALLIDEAQQRQRQFGSKGRSSISKSKEFRPRVPSRLDRVSPRLSPPTPSSPFASASIAKGVTIQTCLCGRGTRPHWVAPKAFAAANRLWHLGVMVAALSARLQCHSASYGDLVLPSSSSFGTPSPTAAAPPSSNQRD